MKNTLYSFLIMAVAAFCLSSPIKASCGLGRRSSRTPQTINFLSHDSLRNAKGIRSILTSHYGLRPIAFVSEDNELLSGLLLERPCATATMVVCPGLLCKKEMYAALISLLPKDYNILIFDARGQGQSRGWHLFMHARSYGKQEYKDVKSAIVEAHRRLGKPIFVMGFCSGAYHAARALITLQNQNLIDVLQIKGLIFDSGWYSVYKASKTAPFDMIKHYLHQSFSRHCPRMGNMTSKLVYGLLYPFIYTTKKLLLDTAFWANERRLNIFNSFHTINIPIMFIQSRDDSQIPFMDVYRLAQTIPNNLKTEWWIEPGRSRHAWHFIHVPSEYRYMTHNFLNKSLQRK